MKYVIYISGTTQSYLKEDGTIGDWNTDLSKIKYFDTKEAANQYMETNGIINPDFSVEFVNFIVEDKEAGNEMCKFGSLEEAEAYLKSCEDFDKKNGNYKPDFYNIEITGMENSLVLKWGTLKRWHFDSERCQELMKEYTAIGSSVTAMGQKDTPRQKEIICELIDLCDSDTILLDFMDKHVSKKEAKDYVMNYGKNKTT